jgi:imidazolonepropionase-like amidohydrolase
MVEFAHSIGIPVATHEIYPAALVGVDNTEHNSATSRRGYSPKMATLQRAYDDVIQLFGKSQRYLTPTLFGSASALFKADPALKDDPRFKLYPDWMQAQVATMANGPSVAAGNGKMVVDVMRAGGTIVAGTDTPNAINLHAEIAAYVAAGMTPFEALKTATVNPARALALDAGTVEPGKLADLIIVDGDPLADITATRKVRRVVANGRAYDVNQLINHRPTTATQ